MKILALGASTSKNSINHALATYTANLKTNANVELLDINDYEMPFYNEEFEQEFGQPAPAKQFYQKIAEADAVIISFAEHNGNYTAAFKNLFDWTTRVDMKIYQNKPMIFLATSPGASGAAKVLNIATSSAHYFAAQVKASISVPRFYDNFDMESGMITNSEINAQLQQAVALLD